MMKNIVVSPNRLAIGLVAVLASALAGCGDGQKASAPPPPEVIVATPVKQTVTDYDEYVGRFVAIDSVEVRARVSGYLESVHFTDGQLVKQGDLLFTIDRRPFRNALDQMRANLETAKSNLKFTKADFDRASQLVREKTITDQTFEQRAQAYRNAEAAVAAGEAQVRQAELDLAFSELRAPISGRIGDRRVSPGNLVTGAAGSTTTLLATIVSMDPIRFEFTFDEASFLRYERLSKQGDGNDIASRGGGTAVSLKLIDEKDFAHKGRMDFIDNVIDRTTGTIRGRAVLDNPKGLFTPGMFGRVRVPGSAPYEALLVPDAAVGTEQIRKYLLVVNKDNVATQKFVTLGPVIGDNMRVIRDGIAADDRVVVSGLMRARPGTKVTPKTQEQKAQEQQKQGEKGAAGAAPKK
jgi:RND family efflux transporter MFP subunit